MGKVVRGCEWALIQRQYYDKTLRLFPSTSIALEFLELVLRKMPNREVRMGPPC